MHNNIGVMIDFACFFYWIFFGYSPEKQPRHYIKIRQFINYSQLIMSFRLLNWILLITSRIGRSVRDSAELIVCIALLALLYLYSANKYTPEELSNKTLLAFIAGIIINLISLLVVYFCWHEGRDLLRGVTFVKGFTRNRDLRVQLSGKRITSSPFIRILDTSIRTLIWGKPEFNEDQKNNDAIRNETEFEIAINKALSKGAHIQILLCHPESLVAKQRAKDLGREREQMYLTKTHEVLHFLYSLSARSPYLTKVDNPNDGSMEVKLFDKLPSGTIYNFVDYVYTGLFPHNEIADEASNLKVPQNSELGRHVIRQFYSLFQDATTIRLEDYMKLYLFPHSSNDGDLLFLFNVNTQLAKMSKLSPTMITGQSQEAADGLNNHWYADTNMIYPLKVSQRNGVNRTFTTFEVLLEEKIGFSIQMPDFEETKKAFWSRYGNRSVNDQTIFYKVNIIAEELVRKGYSYQENPRCSAILNSVPDFRKSWIIWAMMIMFVATNKFWYRESKEREK